MRQNLNRIKNENVPKQPQSVDEIRELFLQPDIIECYAKTLDGQQNLYHGSVVESEKCAFSLFASSQIIDMVNLHIPPESRNYLLDATFKVVPRPYYQLLSVSIEYRNDVS